MFPFVVCGIHAGTVPEPAFGVCACHTELFVKRTTVSRTPRYYEC